LKPEFSGELLMIRNLIALSAGVLVITAGVVACQSRPTPVYDGQNLFLGYCASCHGPVGAGDGPMATHLASKLPNLQTLAARNNGAFPREQLVEMIDGRSLRSTHGTADMPVWGFQFRREEGMTRDGLRNVELRISALVNHIESLQRK